MRFFPMRIILISVLFSNLLFPVGGVVIFNDGTTIEGDVSNVNDISVYITPMGLTFPEEIRMENIDSLRLYDGKLLVANNKVLLLYGDGQFYETGVSQDSNEEMYEDYDVEYVIIPNWSVNLYTGYPLIRSESLSDTYYDQLNPVIGLSIGSPYGLFFGDFFMNGIFELAYYNFTKEAQDANVLFEGLAYQIGLSPGFFIGETSVSFTACTGIYHAGTGFIGGGSIDLPIGSMLINNFGDNDFIENNTEMIESFEIRFTGRTNIVQKGEGGGTYWMDAGISFGYEF